MRRALPIVAGSRLGAVPSSDARSNRSRPIATRATNPSEDADAPTWIGVGPTLESEDARHFSSNSRVALSNSGGAKELVDATPGTTVKSNPTMLAASPNFARNRSTTRRIRSESTGGASAYTNTASCSAPSRRTRPTRCSRRAGFQGRSRCTTTEARCRSSPSLSTSVVTSSRIR